MPTREEAEKSFVLMVKDKSNDKITRVAFPEDVQIGTSNIPSELMLTGRLSVNTKEYKADSSNSGIVNVSSNDTIIGISGSITLASARVNLPNNPRVGQLHHIKDIFGTAGVSPINVYGSGGNTIDSSTYKSIDIAHSSLSVYWNGSEWKTLHSGSVGGSSGPPTRYPAPDSNTLVRFKFDESSAPYYSTGTQNTLNMTVSYGGVYRSTGLYGPCIFLRDNAATALVTSTVPANPSTTAMTAWIWFKPYKIVQDYSWIFSKVYAAGSPGNPPYVGFIFQAGGSGSDWGIGITQGGTFYSSTMQYTNGYGLVVDQWQFLALTYDGTNLKGYYNGTLGATNNLPGTIDYGSTLGEYMVGGPTAFSKYPGWVGAASVENRVLTESELRSIYMLGLGYY